MIEITASLVKDMRNRTGLGIVDCKQALIEASGNIELAIENTRKSGIIKAAKKAGSIAANGVVATKIDGNFGIILEINCETDFVAKESEFQAFTNTVLNAAITNKITSIRMLKSRFEEARVMLVTKMGENINIRRMAFLESTILGSYQHGKRIGVLVGVKNADKKLVKQLAMHIAASKPEFINPEDVPRDTIEKEYQVQLAIAMQSGKPKTIVEKIVAGRIKKYISEISLTRQPFIMDQNKSVYQLLQEHNIHITNFIRFELGEGIEKSESNLPASVIDI